MIKKRVMKFVNVRIRGYSENEQEITLARFVASIQLGLMRCETDNC